MSDHRSPPPDAAACLQRPRPSTQKGGTIVVEAVVDLDDHRRRLCNPDGYRPAECPSCGHGRLHVHAYRGRVLLAEPSATAATLDDPDVATTTIVVYQCVGCEATWRMLPRFIARHLWRTWRTVEASTDLEPPPSQTPVPERTVRRWRERLASAARMLVQIFATSGSALLAAVAGSVGLEATRAEIVAAYASAIAPAPGCAFADVAALVHRLEPGVRLM